MRRGPLFNLCAGAVVSLCFATGASAEMGCADVSLVFAIDASGSIGDDEFAFQMRSTASALRDPEVLSAIQSVGGIVVAVVVWGDATYRSHVVDWDLIANSVDADRFAAEVDTVSRVVSGSTDIGSGLWKAMDLQDNPANCASRRIVNVSGDGRETLHPRRRNTPSVMVARRRAQQSNITINALAITTADHGLVEYFEKWVISGAGAFVEDASGYDVFAKAMKRKLLREILPAVADASPPIRLAGLQGFQGIHGNSLVSSRLVAIPAR